MIFKSVSLLCIYTKYREALPEVVNSSSEREADGKGKVEGMATGEFLWKVFHFGVSWVSTQ